MKRNTGCGKFVLNASLLFEEQLVVCTLVMLFEEQKLLNKVSFFDHLSCTPEN